MMLKDGTGEVEDGTAKTGVVKNQDGRCLIPTPNFKIFPPISGPIPNAHLESHLIPENPQYFSQWSPTNVLLAFLLPTVFIFFLPATDKLINSATECPQITIQMIEQEKLKRLITEQSTSTANYESGDAKSPLTRPSAWLMAWFI